MARLLEGRRALVVGVANRWSIAWGIAVALSGQGARLAFTYNRERSGEHLARLVADLPQMIDVPLLRANAAEEHAFEPVRDELARQWDGLDVLVHAVASADPALFRARFSELGRDGVLGAIDVSAYSLIAMSRALLPLFERAGGGSIMSLTYDAVRRVVPGYNGMVAAKAVLEAETRYLAADLGPLGIRVNCISAGPIKTLRASGVKGVDRARKLMAERAPLRRNVTAEDVGGVAVFLASDLSRSVTGAVIPADKLRHARGGRGLGSRIGQGDGRRRRSLCPRTVALGLDRHSCDG